MQSALSLVSSWAALLVDILRPGCRAVVMWACNLVLLFIARSSSTFRFSSVHPSLAGIDEYRYWLGCSCIVASVQARGGGALLLRLCLPGALTR
jgi:hypothetical protein